MSDTHAGLVERMTNAIEDAGNASVQGEAYTLAIAALAAITQPLYETESAQLLEEMAIALREKGFRLGGSRRMAEKFPDKIVVAPETDWDFYGEDTMKNRAILRLLGFDVIEAPNRDYWDDLLSDIYKHTDHDIQVLLRSDVECYAAAFESIDADTFITKLWKSSPNRDPQISRLHFSAIVCDYFNRLFHEHGFTPVGSQQPIF